MFKLYQLALYFIEKYNFKLVEVRQLNNELWLCNKQSNNYTIIRLTLSSLQESALQVNLKEAIVDSIASNLNLNPRLLEIYIGHEHINIKDKIMIDDGFYDGENVERYFPELKYQVHNVNNMDVEIKRLETEFKNLNKIQAGKKKRSLEDKSYITTIVGVICLVVFLLSLLIYRYTNNSAEVAIVMGGYYKTFVEAGQWFRLLTCGFVHVEITHLLVNMLSLFSLGRLLEKYYGHMRYSIIMIVSILVGNLFIFALEDNTVGVGLSGGLYGLMGALLVYVINSKLYRVPAVMTNIVYILLMNLMINFLPGVAFYAHLGGFISGVLLAICFTNNDNWKQLKNNTIIVSAIILGVLCYKCYDNYYIYNHYAATDFKVNQIYEDINLSFLKVSENKLLEIYGER